MNELFNYDSIVAFISGALGIVSIIWAVLNFILQFLKNKKIKNEMSIVLGKASEFMKSGDANLVFSKEMLSSVNKIVNELKLSQDEQNRKSQAQINELKGEIEKLNNKLQSQKDNLRKIGHKVK